MIKWIVRMGVAAILVGTCVIGCGIYEQTVAPVRPPRIIPATEDHLNGNTHYRVIKFTYEGGDYTILLYVDGNSSCMVRMDAKRP